MLNQSLKVLVRRARPGDAEALAQIFGHSWRLAYTGILPALHLEYEIRRRDATWWRRAISAERNLLVVLHDETVAGYATCGQARGAPRDVGEIYELYISPAYQGLGMGAHLFEACRATLDALDLAKLIVWALEGNDKAHAFYRGCGGKLTKKSCVRFGHRMCARVAFEW
jgi:GNAT superfamily N-acetyltransferase